VVLAEGDLTQEARAELEGGRVKARESQLHCHSHRRRNHVGVENSQ
jgi:hypothetical protein